MNPHFCAGDGIVADERGKKSFLQQRLSAWNPPKNIKYRLHLHTFRAPKKGSQFAENPAQCPVFIHFKRALSFRQFYILFLVMYAVLKGPMMKNITVAVIGNLNKRYKMSLTALFRLL